ncbi:IS110 family transposase [Methanosarcina sp. DH1]|uniref:IS110 family transposase n=1 Tax=Methanosarcina sp. DH1 TaxID=2605695 RepID=UPI001E410011|nr:IS110 family transposase [Methanosarcina sp. DH1]
MNVGIDVAKNVHEACILTESGEQIGNFIRIKNSKSSIQKFRESIESASRELNLIPRIGMEATGIYWYSVYFELSRDYEIHLYNPSQIRGFAAVNIRGSKTDQIDAKTIARMLQFGESPKVCYGDKTRIELKEYCRFRFKLKSKLSDLKKRFVRNVHLIFPGYDQVFSSVFTKTSIAILKEAPRPLDMLEMGEEKLFELMKTASRNYYSPDKTRELLSKAKDSIPPEFIEGVLLFELESLLKLIEYMEDQIKEIEIRILAIWETVKNKHFIQTIPGISNLMAAIIWAELGDIENFRHPDQIVAFAGYDPKVKRSGKKEVISGPNKRGSKLLRWVLGRAVVQAKMSNPVIGTYFNKKISEGKHYNTAMCASAKKLIRIIWAVEKIKSHSKFQIKKK